MTEISDDGIARVFLGYDLFTAEIVRAACEAAGYTVELVRNEHPETGSFTALSESYLLVRDADLEAVQSIIAGETSPTTTPDE